MGFLSTEEMSSEKQQNSIKTEGSALDFYIIESHRKVSAMGAKKQWTGKEKLAIVLQGLKGDRSISELCNEHGITQGMYYKWRDQLLSDGAKLFERGGVDHARERLEHENRKLKETIGELTVELKKNDW